MALWLEIVLCIVGYFMVGILAVIVYNFFDSESKDLGDPGDVTLGICFWPFVGLLFIVCGIVYTVGTMIERVTGKKFAQKK